MIPRNWRAVYKNLFWIIQGRKEIWTMHHLWNKKHYFCYMILPVGQPDLIIWLLYYLYVHHQNHHHCRQWIHYHYQNYCYLLLKHPLVISNAGPKYSSQKKSLLWGVWISTYNNKQCKLYLYLKLCDFHWPPPTYSHFLTISASSVTPSSWMMVSPSGTCWMAW